MSELDDETQRLIHKLERLQGRGLSLTELCRELCVSGSNLIRLINLIDERAGKGPALNQSQA